MKCQACGYDETQGVMTTDIHFSFPEFEHIRTDFINWQTSNRSLTVDGNGRPIIDLYACPRCKTLRLAP